MSYLFIALWIEARDWSLWLVQQAKGSFEADLSDYSSKPDKPIATTVERWDIIG